MLLKLRHRMAREESGFTLVELLVVMLILGLLAAIAIPSFFNQRDKAKDASAKEAARTAQTAIETYSTDNQGSYASASVNILQAIENTLNDVADADMTVSSTATSYTVGVKSSTGNNFTITRSDTGQTSLDCTTASKAGCPANGHWG